MEKTELMADVADGTARGRAIVPAGDGPFPLVVFFADAGGLRPAMYEMAERLATAGYAVLVPDPYWRQAPYEPFDARTVFDVPEERARLLRMANTMKSTEWIADVDALVGAIRDVRVRTDRVLAVGYCMGGRTTFLYAALRPDRVVAAAPIHAGRLVTDDAESPHLLAPQIRAALYLAVADEDASCTPAHQAALRAALDAAGVRYELELYRGKRHGFAVPDFKVHDRDAAEHHWEKVLALFGTYGAQSAP